MFIDDRLVGAVGFDDHCGKNDSKQDERHEWVNTDAYYGFEVVDEFHGFGVGLVE
jgi:hypothetical protein